MRLQAKCVAGCFILGVLGLVINGSTEAVARDKAKEKKKVNKIRLISDNLLRMQVRNLLLKHRLDKIPESIDKY